CIQMISESREVIAKIRTIISAEVFDKLK
ncbi:hypothetical protein LCGC14_0947470, partial [marine sediment metagenome]